MKKSTIKLTLMLFLAVLSSTVKAQNDSDIIHEPIKLSGPRAGLTYIGGEQGKKMIENGITPYISQFGWQFETRYFETRDGFQGLVETIILVGGFETDTPVLSGTLLVGFRTSSGFEAGVGPNVSTFDGGTSSFVIAVGHTVKTDFVNIPVNVAFVPSAHAVKYSFLVGFNVRRK